MAITFKRIQEVANEVIRNEIGGLTEQDLREFLQEAVGKKKRKLFLEAVGLSDGWGNDISVKRGGQADQTTVRIIEDIIKPNLNALLDSVFGGLEVTLTEREIAHLRRVYREKYIQVMEKALEEKASDQVNVDVDELFDQYMKEQ